MMRLHVHVAVEDIATSVRFYTALFAAEPTTLKPDYAKWMLDDPRVNFAISNRGAAAGVDHLGIQAEDGEELALLYDRLVRAEGPTIFETATTCCYAKSDKQWIADPQGVSWENFITHGESTEFGQGGRVDTAETVCCEPGSACSPAPARLSAESPDGRVLGSPHSLRRAAAEDA
jgi:hypothetical protein